MIARSRKADLRRLQFEDLEVRLNLSCVTDTIGDQQHEFARASAAVNCFAFDLYQHYLREDGNLFLSPFSIATALAMAYAGADGETAAEMEKVLHLGSEPGVHDSFRALLDSLGGEELFELEVANALWPRVGFPFHNSYFRQMEEDYHGYAQSLDYSQPEEAARIINDWVSGQTRGKIQDLMDPSKLNDVVMVLTNSIYFKAFWQGPFDPAYTANRAFTRSDGSTVTVPTMHYPRGWTNAPNEFRYTSFDGLEVLEMPFEDRQTSMVVIVVPAEGGSENLSPETLIDIMDWLDHSTPQPECEQLGVFLPKFKTTVSSNMDDVLQGMGMSSAFNSGAANFSKMTDANIWIGEAQHKATIEVNEQGTEAAAATSISFFACFPAGTPVRTRHGDKPIEQIRPGDYVLSRSENDHCGEIRFQRVEETFERQATLLRLHLGEQSIRTTAEHLFFAKDRGWISAAELKPGDMLATDSNTWKPVETIEVNEGVEPVFNFRVAEDHTYFVGAEAWGFAIWTHNCYGAPTPPVFTADRPFHYLIRDNTTRSVLFMGRMSDPTQTENDLKPTVAAQELFPGDANGDHEVGFDDLILLAENFAREDASWEHGDFDGDGVVQFSDFLILADNFGKKYEPVAVPSRATLPRSEPRELENSTPEIQATDAILAGFDDEFSNDRHEESLDGPRLDEAPCMTTPQDTFACDMSRLCD